MDEAKDSSNYKVSVHASRLHYVSTHVFVGRLRVAMVDLTLDSQLDVIKRQIGNTSSRRPSTACMVGVYNSVLEYFVEVS